MFSIADKIGVLVTEVERLPLSTIAEYVAFYSKSETGQEEAAGREAGAEDVEADLMKIFGDPRKHGRAR